MPKSFIEIEIVRLVINKRNEAKLTQSDIASILGVTRGFIGQIEMPTTNSMYSYNQLNKLAQAFKCSPKDFMPEGPIEEE